MTDSTTMSRMEADCRQWDGNAEHRTGTDGDSLTSQWLADEIRLTGVMPTIDEFPFQRLSLKECAVVAADKRAEGIPLFDSLPTNSNLPRPLCSLNQPTNNAIAVGEFSSHGADEATRKVVEARRNDALAGLVAVSTAPHPGISLLNADSFEKPFGIPVLQVASDSREWLFDAAESKTEGRLTISWERIACTASNVRATIPGSDPALAPVVIMTPKSAWWTCTAERIGGIVLWLEAIRKYAEQRTRRTLIFTANTGHELGHIGSKYFLTHNEALIQGAYVWVHLGANFVALNSSIRVQASHEKFLELAKQYFKPEGEVPVGRRPGGEAREIYDANGRYLSVLGSNRLFHHPADRLEKNVDLRRLVCLQDRFLQMLDELLAV